MSEHSGTKWGLAVFAQMNVWRRMKSFCGAFFKKRPSAPAGALGDAAPESTHFLDVVYVFEGGKCADDLAVFFVLFELFAVDGQGDGIDAEAGI